MVFAALREELCRLEDLLSLHSYNYLALLIVDIAMKATYNGVVIAESEDTVVVENNHYFPRESLKSEYFTDSSHTTVCPWKGTASYLNVVVDGHTNANAAWYYPETKPAAEQIMGRVAFWKGVEVS